MTICTRCGKCCYYRFDGRLKKCRFLLKLSSGKTICRIYSNKQRVGKILDIGIVCTDRCNSPFNYLFCPYNLEECNKGKPVFGVDNVE